MRVYDDLVMGRMSRGRGNRAMDAYPLIWTGDCTERKTGVSGSIILGSRFLGSSPPVALVLASPSLATTSGHDYSPQAGNAWSSIDEAVAKSSTTAGGD